MSAIEDVSLCISLLEEGQEITTRRLKEVLPEYTHGAISGALYHLSERHHCLILVTRNGRHYIYSRTGTAIPQFTDTRKHLGSKPGAARSHYNFRLPYETGEPEQCK